jgi:hypothetical protein
MRRGGRPTAIIGLLLVASLRPSHSSAQEHVVLRSDVLLYGDDTEFSNPFREGETIFGAAVRVGAVVDLNDRVSLTLGGFANERFGSDDAFEQVRPVIALNVRGRRSTFVLGTLPMRGIDPPVGPDRGGPHALLPPLQRETLTFERPHEAGLEWTFAGDRIGHDFWLEWQRLNTREHRERFDGGAHTVFRVTKVLSVPAQVHVVHEGGQLYASGPVDDSVAFAAGVLLTTKRPRYAATIEMLGVGSHDVPERGRPDLTRDGKAFFGRAALERSGWRGHVIFWRGRDFVKDEGDSNYLAERRNGSRYGGIRDYSEAGLTRRFQLAPSALLDVSGRLHRVEGRYEYSFRFLSAISVAWKIH